MDTHSARSQKYFTRISYTRYYTQVISSFFDQRKMVVAGYAYAERLPIDMENVCHIE